MNGNIFFWLLLLLAIAALWWFKASGQVTPEQVAGLRRDGALVVDVRSRGEFADGHIDGAVNLPLDELESGIAALAPDKDRPLLLHCLSGTRSAIAARRLKALGYVSVHNLGSFGRARKLAGAAHK